MSIRIPIDAAASIVRAILAIQFFDALSRPYECDVAVAPVRPWRATAAVDSVERAILAIQFFDALLLLLICRKGYSRGPDSVLLSRVNALLLSLLLLLLLLLIGLSRDPGREGYIVIVDAIQVDTLSWRIPCCCCWWWSVEMVILAILIDAKPCECWLIPADLMPSVLLSCMNERAAASFCCCFCQKDPA